MIAFFIVNKWVSFWCWLFNLGKAPEFFIRYWKVKVPIVPRLVELYEKIYSRHKNEF
ncbi:hypothetical protein LEP1GSC036_4834 [Leptospira weilii str. 2006001853]|uniref:Uncharacterized protein n=4 Tax=Leptospira weilii TaxID=28184 RepID=A0A828Z270_9LEPT|nr:hypothetical protein LEP1GSC036_4834 [Leptospira weilii str. 2006001853]EMJ66934.1 hypothetical protein LEP1GSC051_1001 [Leptospira sp. P2653]EMM74721.1 hypothetical protein LEP1GSC038_4400 [Leptospira weilii str. 2006001855]EMN45751.1 hypothetical protein LEP1GSC086_2494 [Leptospira weilii str. LNT 1234]EMN88301.1 hypothetical protein LEP1GSC108_1532 [Leptospira weilii str. UI 13098]